MADEGGYQRKTKVSIYLLKDGMTADEFLTDKITPEEIEGVGTVYKSQIPIGAPSWVETFFDNKIGDLSKGGAGAILRVEVKIGGSTRQFLVSFGYGFHKINLSACEERFGLKIVLNAGDLKNGVRSIDRKNLSSAPKISREQAAKQEGIASFGIDYEQDILQSLTLASTDDDLGTTLSGSASLSVTTPYSIHDIKTLLPKLYTYYTSTKYIDDKNDWVDHVGEAPKGYVDALNTKLLAQLNAYGSDNETCYFSPPELEEWADVIGFGPSAKNAALVKDEIALDDYRKDRSQQTIHFDDIKQVKSRQVYLWSASADKALKHWNLFRCIYAQIAHDGRVFILTNGKWYAVNQEYSGSVEEWYKGLSIQNSSFVAYEKIAYVDAKTGENKTKHSEEDYNKKVAGSDYVCLDRDLISLGPRKDIEACDLYKTGEFLHIKIFTGASAPISHLLGQATVSAELFFGERQFRDNMNAKLPDAFKLNDPELLMPDHGKYKICLGVITNKPSLDLPFFSKVNLRSAIRRLETMGLQVEIVRIEGKF
jgi:uncharacterized protein (TIGR04141 family)